MKSQIKEQDMPHRKKENWGDGPWQKEPDRIEWRYRGVPCLIVRAPVTGSLCGYAAVNPDHPWFEASYSDCVKGCKRVPQTPLPEISGHKPSKNIQNWHMERKNFECKEDYKPGHSPESIIDVHGGLTYSNFCQEGGKICHEPKPGEPEKVWWFGFDCSHAGDLSPAMRALNRGYYDRAVKKEREILQTSIYRDQIDGPILEALRKELEEARSTKSVFSPQGPLELQDHYRPVAYVKKQVELLADQLLEVAA